MKCRLKEILDQRGLKQTFIANKIGISNAAMSSLVTQKSLPTLMVALRIAKLLDLKVEDIWILEDE